MPPTQFSRTSRSPSVTRAQVERVLEPIISRRGSRTTMACVKMRDQRESRQGRRDAHWANRRISSRVITCSVRPQRMSRSSRALLDQHWDCAARRGVAGPRERRFERLSAAVSLQAHASRLGQCRDWVAAGGAADLLETICRDPSTQQSHAKEDRVQLPRVGMMAARAAVRGHRAQLVADRSSATRRHGRIA